MSSFAIHSSHHYINPVSKIISSSNKAQTKKSSTTDKAQTEKTSNPDKNIATEGGNNSSGLCIHNTPSAIEDFH